MPEPINILVCPLDWGLGHATRCIPLIRQLQESGCKVIVAGSGRSLSLLQAEFPHLQLVHLPSYRIRYSSGSNMVFAILMSLPSILYGIYHEHKLLKKLIAKHNIHGLISDNRFGLWNRNIPCVYMTHQVRIRAGKTLRFTEPLLYMIHKWFIRKFDFLWIPDAAVEPNLSGQLSHPAEELSPIYIGPISRFQGVESEATMVSYDNKPDILALISGPEPQRTIFENMILQQAAGSSFSIVLLRGIPLQNQEVEKRGNITIYNHMATEAFVRLIRNSTIVVSRSGYSTIMDLAVLGARAFFVPTPGQTEQEYLAAYMKTGGLCNYALQDEFRLDTVISASVGFVGLYGFSETTGSLAAVKNFVEFICSKSETNHKPLF